MGIGIRQMRRGRYGDVAFRAHCACGWVSTPSSQEAAQQAGTSHLESCTVPTVSYGLPGATTWRGITH